MVPEEAHSWSCMTRSRDQGIVRSTALAFIMCRAVGAWPSMIDSSFPIFEQSFEDTQIQLLRAA